MDNTTLKRALGERRNLRARLAQLEAEVHECRQLNLRLAELTDVVAELLVPLAEGDTERAREVIARYSRSVGGSH